MRDRVSVLAGPSGVGKSSIINALRAEAFDPIQRSRLEAFERKMAQEFEWQHDDRIQDDSAGIVQNVLHVENQSNEVNVGTNPSGNVLSLHAKTPRDCLCTECHLCGPRGSWSTIR